MFLTVSTASTQKGHGGEIDGWGALKDNLTRSIYSKICLWDKGSVINADEIYKSVRGRVDTVGRQCPADIFRGNARRQTAVPARNIIAAAAVQRLNPGGVFCMVCHGRTIAATRTVRAVCQDYTVCCQRTDAEHDRQYGCYNSNNCHEPSYV